MRITTPLLALVLSAMLGACAERSASEAAATGAEPNVRTARSGGFLPEAGPAPQDRARGVAPSSGPQARGDVTHGLVRSSSAGSQSPGVARVDVPADGRPVIVLTDEAGQPRRLGDFQGRHVALFFGYTRCPDVCGSTMYQLAGAARAVHDLRDRIVFVMVSVDGGNDSPAVMNRYVRGFDPGFVGLTGAPMQVSALAANFGAVALPARTDEQRAAAGDWMHSAPVFLLDDRGTWRRTLGAGMRAEAMAGAIRALIEETEHARIGTGRIVG